LELGVPGALAQDLASVGDAVALATITHHVARLDLDAQAPAVLWSL